MDWLSQLIITLGEQVRPHIANVATILVSTVLVIYGNDINKMVKRLVRKNHFLLRYLIFILLCSFGYGMFLLILVPFLAVQLHQLNNYWLPLILFVLFLILGIVAERKNQF